MYRKTFIEVNSENLKYNVKTLVQNFPNYKYYFGVVKGNVYGHGYQAIKPLVEAGINYFAVSSLEEAIEVRKVSAEIPILCLQPIHIDDISEAQKYNITITISNFEYFKQLVSSNISGPLKVHLKINTGFNRLGVSHKEEVLEIVNTLNAGSSIILEGIFSHFATTGIYDSHWDDQLLKFKELTSLINLNDIPIVHFGRSLTLLTHSKIDFCNGVRIGVVMYGYNHSPKSGAGFKSWLRSFKKKRVDIEKYNSSVFKPSLSFYSEIIEIRSVQKGQFVGYGASFKAEENCIIGFLPAGYADGFSKKNVGGDVAINGIRYKIIAVDMGIITVLIDESVKVYDKVELIGENITAIEVSRRNNTNAYEMLCLLKDNIPRLLI
jgi:alanine racemase